VPSLWTQIKVSKLSRMTRGRRALLFCALVIPAVVLMLILLGLQRSYLVEADTGLVRLQLQGSNAWNLRDVTICTPRERPHRSAVPTAGEACSAFDQEMRVESSLTLAWLDDTPAVLRAEAGPIGPRLRIMLPAGLGDLHAPGTEIVVGSDPTSPIGALLFSGEAVLGTVLGSGERYFLHSATWEARQTSWATRALRSSTEKVMTGEALRGAELSVVQRDGDGWRPAMVFGHLTLSPAYEEEVPALSVTLVSEPGGTELQVNHYGLAKPSRIRPDLFDTTATSVLLIAAIAFLSLASAATQLVGDLMSAGRSADAREDEDQRKNGGTLRGEEQNSATSDVSSLLQDRKTSDTSYQ
jgi:hypothetical protein